MFLLWLSIFMKCIFNVLNNVFNVFTHQEMWLYSVLKCIQFIVMFNQMSQMILVVVIDKIMLLLTHCLNKLFLYRNAF